MGLLSNQHGQVEKEHLLRKTVEREISLGREDRSGEGNPSSLVHWLGSGKGTKQRERKTRL